MKQKLNTSKRGTVQSILLFKLACLAAILLSFSNILQAHTEYLKTKYSFNKATSGSIKKGIDGARTTNLASTPPVINNLNGDKVTFIEGGSPVFRDAGLDAAVTDDDSPDFIGGSLKCSITANRNSSQDQLGIMVTGAFNVSGGFLYYNGNIMGTFYAGIGTDDCIVNFTTDIATPASVGELIQALSYYNTDWENPSLLKRTITVTLDDGDGGISTPVTDTVEIIGVNNPPTLSATGNNLTFTPGESQTTSLFSGVTANTIESGQGFQEIDLTVSNLKDGADEKIFIDFTGVPLTDAATGQTINHFRYRVSVAGNTATVKITSADPLISTAGIQSLVEGLTYTNSTTTPTIGNRTISLVSVEDNGGTENGGSDTKTLSIAATVQVINPDAFVTTWKTSTDGETIIIPINPNKTGYNYTVYWGDGQTTSGQTSNVTHTYATAGEHKVIIAGDFPAIMFGATASDNTNDAKLISIDQWGTTVWQGMDRAFDGCRNLDSITATDAPVFASNSTLYNMFANCTSFNADLNNWDLSMVRETSYMFINATTFNGAIDNWDVSNVTNMQFMFQNATAFDQNIGDWDVRKVTLMNGMLGSSGLSTAYYDATLIGWAAQDIQPNIVVGAGGLTYCLGEAARQSLIEDHGWTINGDGKDPGCQIHIWVTIPENDTFHLPAFASESIQQIKQKLQDSTGISMTQQYLTFHGQYLKDGRTIGDYNILNNDTLNLTAVPPITPGANGILYVDSAAATGGDGSSWARALVSFADAIHGADSINRSTPADSVLQIWVAKGTYIPSYKAAQTYQDGTPLGPQAQSFVLAPNVQVYGGFAGTETSLSQRDNTKLLTTSATILSGLLPGGGHVFHVITAAGNVGDATLNGFIISGGYGGYNSGVNINKQISVNGKSVPVAHGGGIINSDASPKLANLVIRDNFAQFGGGIYNVGSMPTIVNVLIHNNRAGQGAGIFNFVSSKPVIVNTTIANNQLVDLMEAGAGMYNYGLVTPVIVNSIIYNNKAGRNPGIYGSANVTYSLIQEYTADAPNHNLDGTQAYDLFVDTSNGNYQLKSSIVVNAGINDSIPSDITTDLAGNPRIYDLASSGIVDLGAFEFQADAATPVHLLYFNTETKNNAVSLNWATATELNNKEFIVARSADGMHFEEIARIPGKGTSSQLNKYIYIDHQPRPGVNYYRLEQENLNGQIQNLGIKNITFKNPNVGIQLYPNPAKTAITISGLSGENTIQLVDMSGRIVQTISSSNATLQINLASIASGVYHVIILSDKGERTTRKLIKQ